MEDLNKPIVYQLTDGRQIVTTQQELLDVVLALRNHVTKFSDIPELLNQHSYLFKNCDPVMSRGFTRLSKATGTTETVLTMAGN